MSINHHIFVNSLRCDLKVGDNFNGDWGGRSGHFGVFGHCRSQRSLAAQNASKRYSTHSNRVRSAYKKRRTQVGQSNTRGDNRKYVKLKPPQTAPLPGKTALSRHVTTPIFRSKFKSKRTKTKNPKKMEKKILPHIKTKPVMNPQNIANDAVRFEPQFVDPSDHDEDHPIFNSPDPNHIVFFNSIPSPMLTNFETVLVPPAQIDSVRYILKSQSDSALYCGDEKRFLTSTKSAYNLKVPSERIELLSPGKKARINRNTQRIKEYTQEKEKRRKLRDTHNINSTKRLLESYNREVGALEKHKQKRRINRKKQFPNIHE